MVKPLDVKASGFSNLKAIAKDNRRYESAVVVPINEIYMCDCDTFGGGDPPCDCNK